MTNVTFDASLISAQFTATSAPASVAALRSWPTPTTSPAPVMTYFATAAKFAHYATYGKSGRGSSTR